MASAEDVGRRLLGEVEECGLNEILHDLRLQYEAEPAECFNFPPLDRLLHHVGAQQQTHKTTTMKPIIELMSISSGDGKTHLLYHLSALAVLASKIGGKQACVIIIDTDGRFSIQRLAAQIQLILNRRCASNPSADFNKETMSADTASALNHIHLFHPQSLASTIATLESLPDYLFNQDRHLSFDREVAFIALDSASAFYWQDRSEVEHAVFLAKTTSHHASGQPSAYFQLTSALKAAMRSLNCASVITTWYLGSQQRQDDGSTQRSFRHQIHALRANLRLVIHRLPVRKFPAGLSLEGALREGPVRQKAVEEGKFECFVNQWDLEERFLRILNGGGFEFRITRDGLLVEEAERTELQPA